MKKTETRIPDCFVLDPVVHGDERGFFVESWNDRTFTELGLDLTFVQDNHSRSVSGVVIADEALMKLARRESSRGVRAKEQGWPTRRKGRH